MDLELEHHYVQTRGVTLHVVQAGPEEGPLVILLHGFPEFWYGWRRQILPLINAGYRVWLPDQRGYNLSDRPPGLAAYRRQALAADVAGLIEAAGRAKATLVGHDWGGFAAWWTAGMYPERIEKLVILNAPHPVVMSHHLLHNPTQMVRSLYALFFQLPRLPEALFRAGNWRLLTEGLRQSSRPGSFTPQDLEHYRRAWSRPGAITTMLNWYRAAFRYVPTALPDFRLSMPVLLIWGAGDVALGRELAPSSIERCEQGRLLFIEEATHWVQHDEPERVNHALIDFFSRG